MRQPPDRAARVADAMARAAARELGSGTLTAADRMDLAEATGIVWAVVWARLDDEERRALAHAALAAGEAVTREREAGERAGPVAGAA